MKRKLAYETPKLVKLGKVSDLTRTGGTNPTDVDAKGGSIPWSQGV